jgi:hypothetical protein
VPTPSGGRFLYRSDMIQRKTYWNHERYTRQWHGQQYAGYPIIFQDGRIQGGVYHRGLPEESITIDPESDKQIYRQLEYGALEEALGRGAMNRKNVIQAIFKVVGQSLVYSKKGVQETLQREADMRGQDVLPRGSIVDLSAHLRAGTGVCRHQALACAWLLERFIARGELGGMPSVDNNEILSPSRNMDGHVWARHTEPCVDPHISVSILDVAQGYQGPLVGSGENAQWNYYRPDEMHLPGNTLDPALVQT